MSLTADKLRQGAAGGGASAHYDYLIEESLLFDGGSAVEWIPRIGSSGYTPGLTTVERSVATFSVWVKRTNINNSNQYLFQSATYGANATFYIYFDSSNRIHFHRHWDQSGADPYIDVVTDAQFKDVSDWYHIMVIYRSLSDADAGETLTTADRYQIWVNGVNQSVTIDDALGYSSSTRYLPYFFGDLTTHARGTRPQIGRYRYYRTDLNLGNTGSNYFEGYMARVVVAQGIVHAATDFGEFDPTYGDWKPIEFSQSVGRGGVQLDFSSSSNILTNSGVTSEIANSVSARNANTIDTSYKRLDSPTNNFCTLNPLGYAWNRAGATLSEGNLRYGDGGSDWSYVNGTIAIPKNTKVYFEVHGVTNPQYIGIALASSQTYSGGNRPDGYVNGLIAAYTDSDTYSVYYQRTTGGTSSTTYISGSGYYNAIWGCAVDQENNTVKFYHNNSLVKTITDANSFNSTDDYVPIFAGFGTRPQVVNFGQDSSFAGNKTAQGNGEDGDDFYYEPPTGFKSLKASNLPDPAVIPSEHFNTVTYTGNGGTQSISSVGFQPDLVWIKDRNIPHSHNLFDSGRGATKNLEPNLTSAEQTQSDTLTSFNSSGFSLSSANHVNLNNEPFVAWNWKANGTGVSNNDGDITATISANQDAGLSIATWTGNGANNQTLGHGLGAVPEMMIIRCRSLPENWEVYHKALGENSLMRLNTTASAVSSAPNSSNKRWEAIDSSIFQTGSNTATNAGGQTYVGYFFKSVDGYSKVGSYIGNANDNAPFIYTGFRPKYVMYKKATGAANWVTIDAERDPHNVANETLSANSADTEYTSATAGTALYLYSNGFQPGGAGGDMNGNNETYIFIAFAEYPFKYTNAR